MNTQKIGIVCYYKFPNGEASTARILAYGRGLVELGVKVNIYSFWPQIREENNPEYGNYHGVDYRYGYSRPQHVSTLRKLFIERPKSLCGILKLIYASNKEQQFDYIFLSFDMLGLLLFYVTTLRGTKAKLVFIGDEYPCPIRSGKSEKLPRLNRLMFRMIFKGIYCRVLMTEPLKAFFDTVVGPQKTHHMASITDVNRFIGQPSSAPGAEQYLCYMGSLDLSKDNVEVIIEAFQRIKDEYPLLKFYIFGQASDATAKILNDLIACHGLKERVLLKGKLASDKVPSMLGQAVAVVNSQTISARNSGGFPTKVGEYLASGRPAVFSAVGNIPQYITDGVNGFCVPPNDPELYAEKLKYILSNYEHAMEVAKCGQQYVKNNFGYLEVAKKLKQFLDHVNTQN